MSNSVSALNGKVEAGEVTVRDAGLQGMITLRGDLTDKKLRRVCTDVTGVAFPEQRKAEVAGDNGLCWMSPDELLVFVPYADVAATLATIDAALAGTHYLAENVSDARAVLTVEGTFAREVMAKLTPVDLHPDVFVPGDFRRSKLGQVAAAFWMRDDETFHVVCFRSVAEYVFGLLANGARAGRVDHLI
ncbi:sarcosine oxidase subunit gamma [Yoonia sp. 2307UL14-13]|uniref:sarcosine oxidase subunit gamma n=1 Tax=Yoonia sp. 2307UL14-13 TaxID=3126506 RepID=UPI0030A7FB27